MPTITAYAPGTFSWTDLAAHDTGVAERFYTELFGWTAEHTRFGPADDDVYVMLKKNGQDVAALYRMDPTQQTQGIPSSWLSYVTVANVGQAAEKARQLGGSVLADAFDVMDFGRMALVADPTGAVIALWEAGGHLGAALKDEPGAMCWNELGSRDPARAGEFYSGLFGWTQQPYEESDAPYTMFMNGEEQAGGMYSITAGMGDMPSQWIPYFAVEDTDEAARRAEELGGTVLHPPHDLPVGRWSLLRDPQGAMFNVIRLAEQGS